MTEKEQSTEESTEIPTKLTKIRSKSDKYPESRTKGLKKGNPETQFTSGLQAVVKGRKGGKKSQEVQRQRREFDKNLEIALGKTWDSSKPMTDLEDLPSLSKEDIMNSNLPAEQKWVLAIVKDLVHGDVRTTELVLRVLGQMPTNKVELSGEVTVKDDPKALNHIAHLLDTDPEFKKKFFNEGGQ